MLLIIGARKSWHMGIVRQLVAALLQRIFNVLYIYINVAMQKLSLNPSGSTSTVKCELDLTLNVIQNPQSKSQRCGLDGKNIRGLRLR